MADWQRTLNLMPEWDQASDGMVSVHDLAGIVATRLRALAPFGDARLDEKREEIADEFDWIAKSKEATADDFNGWMEELYHWADTPLDTHWNGKKVCWVKTTGLKIVI